MKENHYDDPAFFEQYSHFPRSVEGLSAAGEWHELRRMLPALAGKRVLDLGCGFGWHCKYAADRGAASVLGTDLSEKMLAGARERNADPRIQYRRMAMEEMDFAPGSFDLVISSLALHYVEDFAPVCRAVYDCLAEGGELCLLLRAPDLHRRGQPGVVLRRGGNPPPLAGGPLF